MEDYFTREFPNDIDTVERIKEIVHDNIIATCYPYIIEDDKLNLYQRILRECDILVSFSSDYFTHNKHQQIIDYAVTLYNIDDAVSALCEGIKWYNSTLND